MAIAAIITAIGTVVAAKKIAQTKNKKITEKVGNINDSDKNQTEQQAANTATSPNLTRLPIQTGKEIFGRENDLRELNTYLESPDVAVVSIVSFAGLGKSTLVDLFLTKIAPSYENAKKVFGWSFYSEGSSDSTAANLSLFYDSAIKFWGHGKAIPAHDDQKAHLLGTLLRETKSILVLDGVELLQGLPSAGDYSFKEKSALILLTEIARNGLSKGGLVIVSSRQSLSELNRFGNVKTITLQALNTIQGSALLRSFNVTGENNEFKAAVSEYMGHPLSLTLLAKALEGKYNGNISERKRIGIAKNHDDVDRIDSILDYYESDWGKESAEKAMIYLLSLFDRPMKKIELECLRANAEFALCLKKLDSQSVDNLINNLVKTGLIINDKGKETYDCHSLVRNAITRKFRKNYPDELRQAHQVLFEYFREIPEFEEPEDLETMEPLYRAITHGILGERYDETVDIYWRRISRKRIFYSQKILGAHSSDLFAISQFFPNGLQDAICDKLSPENQGWILGVAAFLLESHGRFRDALEPRKQGIILAKKRNDYRLAAGDSYKLVGSLVSLGMLREALEVADKTISYASQAGAEEQTGRFSEKIDTKFLIASYQCRRAMVLHRLGRLDASLQSFENAEKEFGTKLVRTNGFYYCALRIDRAESDSDWKEIQGRGERAYEISEANKWPDVQGNDKLTIAIASARLGDIDKASMCFTAAISLIKKSGRRDKLANALISRALFYWEHLTNSSNDFSVESCKQDLNEAEDIAIPGGMELCKLDIRFVRALISDPNHRRELLIEIQRDANVFHYEQLTHKVEATMRKYET